MIIQLYNLIELVDRRCAAVLVLAYIRGQFICQTAPEIELNNLLLLVGSTRRQSLFDFALVPALRVVTGPLNRKT